MILYLVREVVYIGGKYCVLEKKNVEHVSFFEN
jgi:hypothetical protein